MAILLDIPYLYLFILMILSLTLAIVLIIQVMMGTYNAFTDYRRTKVASRYLTFNLYLFHHLIICIIRCITIFLICFFLFIYNECLSLGLFIHFLLLLSTFDLFLMIIGETAHFQDSIINHQSALNSKYCLIFGIFFNYFLSSLFLSIHITIGGDSPLTINMCKSVEAKVFVNNNNNNNNNKDETYIIPIIIIHILFVLLDLLSFAWIYMSYKDIFKFQRKRFAKVFFYSLVFTKCEIHERANMVDESLKRLLSIRLFILSNIIAILPVLTIKTLNITLNIHFQLFFIYLTLLPWCESTTFLFFKEMQFNFRKKTFQLNENYLLQKRIGKRLSSYREYVINIQTKQNK